MTVHEPDEDGGGVLSTTHGAIVVVGDRDLSETKLRTVHGPIVIAPDLADALDVLRAYYEQQRLRDEAIPPGSREVATVTP